jgi:hypothetical protein
MDWYEAQRPGLADAFLQSFEAATAAIAESPFQYQMFGKTTRRAMMPGFPHGLIYEVSDTEITVLACFHPSRNPASWRK